MVPFATNRICVLCAKKQPRSEMINVPNNPSERQAYVNLLGEEFERNMTLQKYPFLCLSHFPPEKRISPRKKIFPYENGVPPQTSVSVPDFSDDELEEVSDSLDYDSSDETYEQQRPECGDFAYCHIIADFQSILPQIRKCWNCLKHSKDCDATTSFRKQGLVMIADMTCEECGSQWKWESSKRLEAPPTKGPRTYPVNLALSTALLATGIGFTVFGDFARMLSIPTLSEKSHYDNLRSTVYPAVRSLHGAQKAEVMKLMKREVQMGGGIHIAGDGQYDSRGYSAYLCRYTLQDVKTSLILDFQVCRKGRGGNSGALEKQGLEKCFPRLLLDLQKSTGTLAPILTFTSDRNSSITSLMAREYPNITHLFDNWHLIRSIRKDIIEKMGQRQFEPLLAWIRPFIAHIRTSIAAANGDGRLAFQKAMSFFHHAVNIHSNFQPLGTCQFDLVTQCSHGPIIRIPSARQYLDPTNQRHSKALKVLENIMIKGNRATDFESVSPHFSTATVESFHSLATRYLPKEKFYDEVSYNVRSKLATVHWNALQLDEMAGRRYVVGSVPYYCKTRKTLVEKRRKTKAENRWRQELLAIVCSQIPSADPNYTMPVFSDSDNESDDGTIFSYTDSESDEDEATYTYSSDTHSLLQIDAQERDVRAAVEEELYQFN